jgi:hypothetical protein
MRYRLAEEQTDDKIADRDMGGDDLIALPAETWRAIRDRAEELLTAAEVDGLQGAVAWLSARRLAWSWATPAPRPDPVRARTTRQPDRRASGRSGRCGVRDGYLVSDP